MNRLSTCVDFAIFCCVVWSAPVPHAPVGLHSLRNHFEPNIGRDVFLMGHNSPRPRQLIQSNSFMSMILQCAEFCSSPCRAPSVMKICGACDQYETIFLHYWRLKDSWKRVWFSYHINVPILQASYEINHVRTKICKCNNVSCKSVLVFAVQRRRLTNIMLTWQETQVQMFKQVTIEIAFGLRLRFSSAWCSWREVD